MTGDGALHRVRLGAVVLTPLALVAFAANSILCRLALGRSSIDPATFSSVRLATGALTLTVLVAARGERAGASPSRSAWLPGFLLFLYAVPFSLAYVSLSAGSGALILFACVQATMLVAAHRGGERSGWAQRAGFVLALAGLGYLLAPGLSRPPIGGSILMGFAGVAWGLYTLRGRGVDRPLAQTARNFVRALPFALVVNAIGAGRVHATPLGILLAGASGALASGVGYAIWYTALRGLTTTRAAIVQLSVPVLAAAGGVAFLGERITPRLVSSAILVLGGIGLAVSAAPAKRACDAPTRAPLCSGNPARTRE